MFLLYLYIHLKHLLHLKLQIILQLSTQICILEMILSLICVTI